MVNLLLGTDLASSITERLRGEQLHAPAHFDAEVLSALGRLHRGGELTAPQVVTRLGRLESAPVERHALVDMSTGAWKRRHNLPLVDALYVELAHRLDAVVITSDTGMAAADRRVELVHG
ncbi:MAG: type II toxin-antitoxin system VapC family toxin [Acidimicrobiia bacterium]|nr:type II toxin-antitoxin system VapC family toxin [Acidimicrobiia bacterium]